ncbi:MAG: aconitase family protein, partial [Candidatus Zixiibacteriota bacterium]
MTPRRKMPTKGELLQLQKLYKTDEKIGERLGGVPTYLVAYWRRKKGIPRHSQPKFSETEIRNLWERFGDDDRCGLELGISKAAFYNWRRKYGIREKPPFLKLEQLELSFPGFKIPSRAALLYGKRTVSQKILARAAGREKVEVGELVVVEPDVVITHDDTGEVIETFKDTGAERVWNPGRIIVTLAQPVDRSGDGPDKSGRPAVPRHAVREFVRRQGIRGFFDIHQGACHQVVLEQAEILPGQMGLSTDRFASALGAIAACTAEVDAREMAAVWASGKTWLHVPKTIRIDITGRRPRGVCATDVALSIIQRLGVKGAKDKAVEYYGSAVMQMNVSERAALAALAAEMGAANVMMPFESVTRRFFAGRTD